MDWPLLAELSDEDRRGFLSIARRRRFAKGEVVFHAGDPGDSLHLVAKGRFAVWAGTTSGDTTMLSVLGTKDFFGELALVDEEDRRAATVSALEPAETLSVGREEFERLRAVDSSVDRVLVVVLAAQVRRMSELVMEALYVPAETRVLRRLLALAELWGGASAGLVIPFTQEDLAGLAGTTRPTANRTLRQAELAGLLVLRRGRIELVDPIGLGARARMP
jgi:CRP-like cAMP-binding protein